VTLTARPDGAARSAGAIATGVALTTCPTLLFPFASTPFDPPKSLALWVLAAIALPSISAELSRRTASRIRTRPMQVLWAAAAVFVAVAIVASATSAAPALAWLGSPLRRMGALTEIALLVLMLVIAVAARDRHAADAVITAALLGAVPPTLLVLGQWAGADLVRSLGTSARIGGPFGNPVFCAAYLISVWPLTAARSVVLWRTRSARLPSAAVATLLLAETVALVALGARGPAAALVAALVIVSAASIAIASSTRVGRLAAVAVVVAAVGALAAGGWHIARTQIADERARNSSPTLAVRAALWRAAWDGIRLRPHPWLGQGPEATMGLLAAHAAPELPLLEGVETVPDRAHNDVLETVAAFGVLGLIGKLSALAAVAWAFIVAIRRGSRRALVVAGGAASVLAHTIEIQASLDTIAASLIALTSAGLVVAMATEDPEHPASPVPRSGRRSGPVLAGWCTAVLVVSSSGATGDVAPLAAWVLAAATWALASAVACERAADVGVSAAAFLAPAIVWSAWPGTGQPPIDRVWLFLWLMAGVAIGLTWWLQPTPRTRQAIVATALAALAVAVTAGVLGASVQADVILQAGDDCQSRGDWTCASDLFRRAAAIDPANDVAAMRAGDALLHEAETAPSGPPRERLMGLADGMMRAALAANPYDYHHARNLAALERRSARLATGAERTLHLDRADGWYALAIAKAPSTGVLYAERGNLALERGRPDDALAWLDRAIELRADAEALAVADALLRATGADTATPDTLERAAAEFAAGGHGPLSAAFARRAASRRGDR
jgi:O-antigen ligase